jgi:high-affinity iron transporter
MRPRSALAASCGVPAPITVLDGAQATITGHDQRARWLQGALGRVRDALSGHAPPRTVARLAMGATGQLAAHGVRLSTPRARPDLARGAALYQVACAPCHGPPRGPPPAAAAHLVPRPPRPTESALDPYELFNRIAYGGGAGTAMPAFAETLSERGRWDVAFYLLADRWPPCESPRWSPLARPPRPT